VTTSSFIPIDSCLCVFIDDAFHEGGGGEVIDLPPAELATLPQIAKTIGEVLPFNRERVATMVVRDQTYIHKLMEIFRICEERENTECLRLMFKVVKGLISLNDGHIFDIIFSDEYMMDIVGALEYDSELSTHQDHRKYLREQVVFKEAVSIHDPAILSKIHQTYRIGYIKDVILPKVLDDQTFVTINSIMLFNNVAVVSSLQNDSTFLSELFSKLRSPDTPDRCQRDLVLFIQEFCNLSKHLQLPTRSQLFSTLVKEGLFDIVKTILESSDESIRLSGFVSTWMLCRKAHSICHGYIWGSLLSCLFGFSLVSFFCPSHKKTMHCFLSVFPSLFFLGSVGSPGIEEKLRQIVSFT
jgi:protein phosphatase-4 regulatory subunit 3